MTKKKRRGRPRGSKNKATKSVAKMDVAQLGEYIDILRNTLAAKIQQQREHFERQLANLGVASGNKHGKSAGARLAKRRSETRRKPKPKYQSKKNARLKWTGRGMLPVWMREEMKGTKLKKENFLIK